MRYVPGGRVKVPTSTGSVTVKVEFSLSLCAYATGVDATPRSIANVPRAKQLISFFISNLFLLLDFGETGDGPATGGSSGARAESDHSSPLDEVDHQDHDGDDEEDMDEAAHRVRGDHSESPEDQEDHEDRPEHGISFLPSFILRARTGAWRGRTPAAPELES